MMKGPNKSIINWNWTKKWCLKRVHVCEAELVIWQKFEPIMSIVISLGGRVREAFLLGGTVRKVSEINSMKINLVRISYCEIIKWKRRFQIRFKTSLVSVYTCIKTVGFELGLCYFFCETLPIYAIVPLNIIIWDN